MDALRPPEEKSQMGPWRGFHPGVNILSLKNHEMKNVGDVCYIQFSVVNYSV